MDGEFQWNAEEALKLLNRGYRVVLMQDGLGDITALAIPKGTDLEDGVEAWRECDGLPEVPSETEEEQLADIQRSVFAGPNKFAGGGGSVAMALHCLTEKAVFHRLPDGKGGFYTPPPPKGGGT